MNKFKKLAIATLAATALFGTTAYAAVVPYSIRTQGGEDGADVRGRTWNIRTTIGVESDMYYSIPYAENVLHVNYPSTYIDNFIYSKDYSTYNRQVKSYGGDYKIQGYKCGRRKSVSNGMGATHLTVTHYKYGNINHLGYSYQIN